jgi:hypothetical protein
MFQIEIATTIRKSRRDIAWVMFNPLCDTAWAHQVLDVRPLAQGPLQAGSSIARVIRFLGRRYHDVTEVVEYVPGRCIEMATQRPVAMRVRYSLEGIPEGVIVRVRATGQSDGLLRLISPVVRRLLRRNYRRSLQDLKVLMESNQFRTLAVADGRLTRQVVQPL